MLTLHTDICQKLITEQLLNDTKLRLFTHLLLLKENFEQKKEEEKDLPNFYSPIFNRKFLRKSN